MTDHPTLYEQVEADNEAYHARVRVHPQPACPVCAGSASGGNASTVTREDVCAGCLADLEGE